MAEARTYTVRPFSKPARTDLKDVFRIYVSPATLVLHKFHSGDACVLQNSEGRIGPAIAWAAQEKIQDSIVQTSKTLQGLCGLKLGDKVTIQRSPVSIADVQSVILSEKSQDGLEMSLAGLDNAQDAHWEWFLEYPLGKAETLCVGMDFEAIEVKGQKRSFKVQQINSSRNSDVLYRFVSSSKVQIQADPLSDEVESTNAYQSLMVTRDGVGGLTRQLDQLNQRLAAYANGIQQLKLPSYYRPRRGGVLLYGPSGTGKSLILRQLAEAGWHKVYHIDARMAINHGSSGDMAISSIFADARRHQPSVIIIDRLDLLAGKIDTHETTRSVNITSSLCTAFDALEGARTLIIAATTSLGNIDESLRRPGYFDFQIEIPIPDSRTRAEILKILSALPKYADARELDNLGDRTHGFVGADLDKLVQLAVDKAKARVLALTSSKAEGPAETNGITKSSESFRGDTETLVEVTETDLNNALLEVRPTAMQEVFLETPKVQWSDIGGQHEIKKSLKQAVEWPLKVEVIPIFSSHVITFPSVLTDSPPHQYPTEMYRLGIEPKKGLLLYGPPGCSKTLTAKAVATSSGLNFLAVKGAELLSMYVGESERAVREVFRKARAASPSIIFFDEIDAIGASREGGSTHHSGGGLNVLTTLLNELDGIEILKGVFVLAATNKPEVLDPALMRPGRLDTILYVGPPDHEARYEILQIRIRRMDVCDEEVDLSWLADMTDGYSGAELVSVCQRAGYAALEEQEEQGKGGEVQLKIGRRHFEIGLGEVKRQITPEMKARYERWGGGKS
ncbi:AAA+-type ATPase [Lignoscripta atroalba]|nr:AAA+-type ATPase [Lignoscripta atroalba]